MLVLRKTLLSGLLLFLFFGLSAQTEVILPGMKEKSVIEKEKKSSRLTGDLEIALANTVRAKFGKPIQQLNKAVRIERNRIFVDLIAKSDINSLATQLARIDFEKVASFGKIISGWIYIEELGKLNDLSHLRYARPSYKPIKAMGSVHSQGDSAQYSKLSRTEYGLDGAGLKIGILSDSYNTLSGEAAGVSSGDLPGVGNPNGHLTPVTIVKDYSSTGSDEARGMAEIIHDVAPAAILYARTAFEGEADFAQGILDLGTLGCDIIVDDVGYFAEPFFQDGMIAQAADVVVGNGAVYFSAAGNSGRNSYEAAFEYSGFEFGGKPIHDFDPGVGVDYIQEITIPSGVTLIMTLQWDEPFGSLPNSVADCQTDLDVFLYNSALSNQLAFAATNNIATGDPYEIISYSNTSAGAITVNLLIQHYSGLAPSNMKYVIWSNSPTIDEYDTESSTIVGHANATDAIACGAAAWYNTTAYGATNTMVNNFSSAGGTPILFDKVGNAISSSTRLKPEVVGPDGANTSFFGTDIANDADSHPNFFGTSASAPHLAGLGALLLQAGAVDQADVLTAMTSTSVDLDDPSTGTMDSGFDFGTGHGMVEGKAAVEYIQAALPVELADFRIQALGDRHGILTWSTLSEFNNESFVIQHRRDNTSFSTIAEVLGKGNANERTNYELHTKQLAAGQNYFKLLQKDFGGRLTEHSIVSLEIKSAQASVWSYQDFEKQLVAVESERAMEYSIQIYNSNGKQIFNIEDRVSAGERQVTEWLTDNWSGGVYFYTVNEDGDESKNLHTGKFRLLKY